MILPGTYSTTQNLFDKISVSKDTVEDVNDSNAVIDEPRGLCRQGGLRTLGKIKKSLPSRPLISIITVCFNCDKTIAKTIESVITQTYDNIEYIIIDGGSTDQTKEIITTFENAVNYWISEDDKGIYDAMNKGIDLAEGEWINFMNAGDTFFNSSVINDLFYNSDYKDQQFIFGKSINIYPTFKQNGTLLPFKDMWKAMPICHQATFMKTEMLITYRFDLKYRYAADYDLLARLLDNKVPFLFVDQFINFMDCIESTSINNILKSIRERREIALRNEPNWIIHLYYAFLINRIKIFSIFKKIIPKSFANYLIKIRYFLTIYDHKKNKA